MLRDSWICFDQIFLGLGLGKLYPARGSLVSDIPAGDGNTTKPFFYSALPSHGKSPGVLCIDWPRACAERERESTVLARLMEFHWWWKTIWGWRSEFFLCGQALANPGPYNHHGFPDSSPPPLKARKDAVLARWSRGHCFSGPVLYSGVLMRRIDWHASMPWIYQTKQVHDSALFKTNIMPVLVTHTVCCQGVCPLL